MTRGAAPAGEAPPTAADIGELWSYIDGVRLSAEQLDSELEKLGEILSFLDTVRLNSDVRQEQAFAGETSA